MARNEAGILFECFTLSLFRRLPLFVDSLGQEELSSVRNSGEADHCTETIGGGGNLAGSEGGFQTRIDVMQTT